MFSNLLQGSEGGEGGERGPSKQASPAEEAGGQGGQTGRDRHQRTEGPGTAFLFKTIMIFNGKASLITTRRMTNQCHHSSYG